MKQFITLLSVAALMTACTSKSTTPIASAGEPKVFSVSEAADYAAFTEWKQQQAAAAIKQKTVAPESKPQVIYIQQPAPVRTVVKETPVAYQAIPQTTTQQAEPTKKKQWSKAAKGAVIGAGTGAVAGAIISKKNRALGAVIGGVAGGGVGYGIGKTLDKRTAEKLGL